MKRNLRLLALALLAAIFSVQCTSDHAADTEYPTSIEQHFASKTFLYNGSSLAYRECNILSSTTTKVPLVIILHGQYANGSDNISQLRQDAMIRIWHHFSSAKAKATLLAPQCPVSHSWDEILVNGKISMSQLLSAFIEEYINDHPAVDSSRIYILGYADSNDSSGAGGVWRMISDYPDTFAAAMAVAANPDQTIDALQVAKTPVLAVKDSSDTYAVSHSLDSFGDQVRDAGGTIREDVLNVGSRADLCREAFSDERLEWVLQFSKE